MTDLDPESRRILELASAARTPSAGDKARVAQRLDAAVGLAAGASSAPVAAKSAAAFKGGGVALFKWIAASAIVAVAAISFVAVSPRPSTPVQTARPSVPAPQPVQPATNSASAPASAPAPASQTQPTPHRVEHRRPVALPAPQDEIGLLHRAQAAWRAQDAKTALALLDEHRARYPRSQLEPERDALRALSLCDLGRRDEGRRLARSVIARAANSPLRASLEQSCALK